MARSARGRSPQHEGRESFHDECIGELTEYTSRIADATERIAASFERLVEWVDATERAYRERGEWSGPGRR